MKPENNLNGIISDAGEDVPDHLPSSRQVGGDHYRKLSIQPWDFMKAFMTHEQFIGYLLGNVIKYASRNKGDKVEDYRKMQHYVEKLMETIKQ